MQRPDVADDASSVTETADSKVQPQGAPKSTNRRTKSAADAREVSKVSIIRLHDFRLPVKCIYNPESQLSELQKTGCLNSTY